MVLGHSIFQPRKSHKSGQPDPQGIKQHPVANTASQIYELTKNDHYCISKLPALPNVLKQSTDSLLNGYTDSVSNYSVVVSQEGISVWSYKSTDSSPLTIEFPVDDSPDGILPLAVLTNPSGSASKDPGIVIVNATTGLLQFYESVQHSPALGLIGNKNLEISLAINSEKGEFVTFAENLEPAGVVVVTSWKRVLLVSLRSSDGKPGLALTTLMKPASNFLSRFFNSNDVNEDIVSIRSGRIDPQGNQQEIIIQESSGLIHVVALQLSTASGAWSIDTAKSFTHNLNPYVENSIDGFTKLSSQNIQYFDVWRVSAVPVENTYLILCVIADQFTGDSNKLVLVTARLEKSGVLIYGSHRSNSFDGALGDSRPRLFVPHPETTAFVVLGNSVVLTDLDYSYILKQGTVLYYKPRWEDLVKISLSVNVVGYGYENQSSDSNPTLILITKSTGVLRIERFLQDGPDLKDYYSDPSALVKSHIEQAIFYSNNSSIDFDMTAKFPAETINSLVLQVVNEVLSSESPYLPTYSPTVSTILEKKAKLFVNLIEYSDKNFPDLSSAVKTQVIHALEKVLTAQNVWILVDSNEKIPSKLKEVLNRAVTTAEPAISEKGDKLRIFFNNKVADINVVLTEFLKQAIELDLSSDYLLGLMTRVLYDSILEIELKYAQSIPNRKSWVFDTDLLLVVEKFFQTKFCDESIAIAFPNSPGTRVQIKDMCHALYYFINEAISYMKTESNENLTSYVKWYNKTKVKWIQCLLSNNLNEEAIILVETYHDFTSLAAIIEDERQRVVDQFGIHSSEYEILQAKYYIYFEKYQYEFASALFDYYIKKDSIQILLTGFPRYNHLLEQYLTTKYDKVSNVAWIKNLIDGQYNSASEYLLRSAELNNEESQNSQELKYSLAKLSAIAGKGSDSMDVDSTLFTIETKLILIRIQKSLLSYLNEALVKSEDGEDVKFKSFLKFVNDKIDHSTAVAVFEGSFPSFINNKRLDEKVLIDYLTFVKPSAKFNKGFANAFRVASLLQDQESYKAETKKVWSRLLAITEDWEQLKNTSEYTDLYVQSKLQLSILHKTMQYVNGKEIQILEEMLQESEVQFEDENILLQELNRSFFIQAKKNVEAYDLLGWIRSIKTKAEMTV